MEKHKTKICHQVFQKYSINKDTQKKVIAYPSELSNEENYKIDIF